MSTTSQPTTGTNIPTQQTIPAPHPCPSCGHCPTCGKSNRGSNWPPNYWPPYRAYWSVVPPNYYGTFTTSSPQSGLSYASNSSVGS